ncbi:MAG: cyclic nucleotide-binding domain-containing protein [Ilumatobacteraceae bacterium]
MAGFDLGPIALGPTPVALLISVSVVGAVLLLVFLLASQAGGKLVDRRWPANQPLTPSEVLWGESGGHVKKTFPGLDPVIARDLTQYISTKKVPAGTTLVEAGDLPTQFMLLKSGAAEADGGTALKAGDSIGGDNIISRTPHRATVRTTAASEIVSLEAEDYLAAMALGMSDDDDDYVVHALGAYFDDDAAGGGAAAPAARPAAAPAATALAEPPRPAPAPQPPAGAMPPPAVVAPPAGATHRTTTELPGFNLPAGGQTTRVLPVGTFVQQVESLPGWVHVRTVDGWQGWVAEQGVVRL